MYVIDCAKANSTKIPQPYERILKPILTPDTNELFKDISIIQAIFYPHQCNDMHTHDVCEMLYIISGYGHAIVDGIEYEIKSDSLIIAPAGIPHQQFNDSDETMKILTIWYPAVTSEFVINRALDTIKT